MSNAEDFNNTVENQWCPGCPNFGILKAFKKAFAEMDKSPDQVCLVSGIGQAAKLPHYLNCNFFNGLHGRALPAAQGIHAANPNLTTVVVTGDGDCYGEGGNHFLHAILRNPDITVVVHNNELYALTKGQASPTTLPGEKRTLQMKGVEKNQANMLAMAMINNCTFVARGFAGEIDHLKDLIIRGVRHKGLSYIDVVQPCITWGTRPVSWYKERVYQLESDYDPSDLQAALEKTTEWWERIPIGVLYQTSPRETYAARFRNVVGGRAMAEMEPLGAEAVRRVFEGYYPV